MESPFRDLPPEVRLVCVQTDLRSAVADVCSAWGLTGPETLVAVRAVLGSMCEAALESTAAELARAMTRGGDDAHPEGDAGAQ